MSKLIIGNLKMNILSPPQQEQYLSLFKKELTGKKINNCELILCPPAIHLPGFQKAKIKKIILGAQNMFWESEGAYTGEVSPLILGELGCTYVILGHSERRFFLQETSEMIGKKVEAAFAQKLIPIICVGETYEEKKQGISKKVLRAQLRASFKNSSSSHPAIIAYEPRWAISTQKHAEPTPSDAVEMILFLKELLEKDQGKQREKNTRFIYGGSVNTHNAQVFLRELVIDGVLVGGASTRAEEFQQMLEQIRSIHKEQS